MAEVGGPRVGIPRGLGFFEYHVLWQGFFEGLGVEAVASPPTNRDILDRGVRAAVEEACLPVKVYFGHVMELAPRVDLLFVPRLVRMERRLYTCPKFLGLPEMVKSCAGRLPPLLCPVFDENRRGSKAAAAFAQVASRLGVGLARARRAWRQARARQARYRAVLAQGWPRDQALAAARGGALPQASLRPKRSPDGRLKVAVLGHSYLLYDPHLNLGLLARLERLGVEPITGDVLPEERVLQAADSLPKRIFWSFARRTMGGGLYLLERGGVDGIIHLVSFGCGSDALITDLLERFARRRGRLPFMLLTLDEHSGEAGLQTRLEAFVDMIRRRRAERAAGWAG
ncbi:MAG: acyl-CoA dehydratase activase-related protein [Acetobacteraceae bacterium]|nr:acyl-CoA dehydratase activase-related protein [Acetobacteraceae bacterium]